LTHSSDFKTYTLDPDEDFAIFESCDVTVLASGVSDQDNIDPPDHLTANFFTGFTSTNAEQCGDPATFIHDIQGSLAASLVDGSAATIEGIVTGDYQGAGQFGGYYLQEEDDDTDGNPATSEGIFVFSTNTAVARGQKVRVTGTVDEFFNLTEITSVTKVLVCDNGAATYTVATTPVAMPVANLGDWERYEGMQISIAQELTVTETFTLGRFGEVSLSSGGRLYNPTAIVAPGAPAIAQQNLNNLRRIVLDDGNNEQNIDPTNYPTGGLSASNTLRSGYTVTGLTGILEERFNGYRIQRLGDVNFVASNPRLAAPDDVGGLVKVASMNVLNFFNGNGLGGGFPTERGANTLFEYNRQRAKMLAAMLALDADVIGLLEVENDATDGHSAIEDIVSGLNAVVGPGTWTFVDTGPMGGDVIRNAIIYRQDVVAAVGEWAFIDGSVDPRFIDRGNRPTVAQTFEVLANGGRFTFVVNHLRSKGSACDSATSPFNDPDTGDGQGNCNLVRTAAANAVVDWLATDPTGAGDTDYLLVGDMNSYAKEDPITAFVNGGYTDLIGLHIGPEAYSYVFGAQSGYIDHALGSDHLVGQVTGVDEYHNNADEPIVLDYNTEFKTQNQINNLFYAPDPFRASDHDPLIVGLDVNAAPVLGPISAPAAPVPVNTPVAASAGFTDGDVGDTHTAVIDWGDGTTSAGSVSEANGSGTVSGSHVYTTPGIYTIVVVVTDAYGDSSEQTYQYVVVYDPNGAFVTGGGWIDSPAGAYTVDPQLRGRASFGFVAKYLKGANVPVGNTQFHFHAAAGFDFHSTAYEWLVVAGTRAQFKGVGELNGVGGYGFMLTADDGAPDTFRIKLWYTDASGEHVVYDNGSQQAIGGGSIVVKR
jgi:predicted extracellular nuclease